MKLYFIVLPLVAISMLSAGDLLEWNTPQTLAQWVALRNVKCEQKGNSLILTEIKADCQLLCSGIQLDPEKYNRISFRYRATGTKKSSGELFYAHTGGSFSGRAYWQIPDLISDGKWHTMVLTEKNLKNPVSWFEGGMITRLRLDPINSPGGQIEITEIKLYYEKTETVLPLKKKQLTPKVVFQLDEPAWPAVKPEFREFPVPILNESYFQGKMIKSPHDLQTGGKNHRFWLIKEFMLKEKPVQGWIQYTADDKAELFVNGTSVSSAHNWRIPEVTEVTSELKKGSNVWGFCYENARGAGGVLGELFVKYTDGSFERFHTNGSFRCSTIEIPGWNKIGFAAETWGKVVEQNGPPSKPWSFKLSYNDFAFPQKFLGASVTPAKAKAGSTVKIHFDFNGIPKKGPIGATLVLRRGETIVWDEPIIISDSQIKTGNGKDWFIEFDYTLPLYLNSNTLTIRLESGSFFCRAGGFPETKFSLERVEKDPAYPSAPVAQIKKNKYGPCVSLNGEPIFLIWGAVSQERRPARVPRHSDAPLNLVTVYTHTSEFWPECGKFDPANFDRQAELYRRQNKDAWFMWDLTLFPPRDWAEKYPDEMCRDENGEVSYDGRLNFSFASQQALKDMKETLEKAIAYLEKSPYANRIIGYRINSGHTIEWLGWDPAPGRALDFSPVARKAFKGFAQKQYPGLKDFSIPSLDDRKHLDNGELLWNPAKHLNVIAYHDFYSNSVVDMILSLCRKAKELVNDHKLVGTYYGYVATLHSSGNSQMRAHYALKRLLDSGTVDFLMSPQSYSIRQIGGTSGDMKPFGSLNMSGVIPVIEDDTRTHNGPYINDSANYQTLTEKATLSVMRRNMGIALCRNQPIYLYALCAGTEFDFPAMAEDMAKIRKTGEFCLNRRVKRNAEIALVISEDTIKSMPMLSKTSATGRIQTYQKDGSVKQIDTGSVVLTGESFNYNATRYARLGSPSDMLLAEDLKDHPGDYKLYIFINCFKYDEAFLKAVEKLRQRNCVLFWVYAPGYTFDGKNSEENMKRLTGIDLKKCEGEVMPAVKLSDGHWMGTQTTRITPMFHVPDTPKVEKLGIYENGQTGLAAVKTGKALSMFCGAYQFDVPFLTELAKRAGTHIYSESFDPIEANTVLFTLHARFPGKKTVRLPRKADVLDVLNRKVIAKNKDTFTFEAPLHSSWIFYYGDDVDALLKELK